MPSIGNHSIEDAERAVDALLTAFRAGEAIAIDRVRQHLPQVKYNARGEAATFPLTLSEAQTVIARENGAQSWGELRLKHKLEDLDFGDELKQFKGLVYAHDAEKLDALLKAHPELKSTIDDPHFYYGSTALIISKEKTEVLDVLLKHGADINAKSQWWAGDFHILEGTSAEAAERLIKRGAEITVHAAAEQGWLASLETAYRNDASIINLRGGDGKTPLHYATDPAVMDWLLARGADLEARDLDHVSTPLQWHLGARNHDAARELVKRGAQVDIFAAVMLGEMALVNQALAAHPHAIRARVNQSGYDLTPPADGSHQYVYTFDAAGLSPHQAALEYGRADIFARLIEQSPPDVQLLAYCANGDREAAQRIAAAQPDIVAQMADGDRRQLIHAAWTKKAAVVELMASLGFDLHIRDDDAMTPLHAAAFHGFADVIRVLLDADDDPPLDWLNGYGGTPLTTCLYGRQHSWRSDGDFPASLKLLIEAGSEVKAEWLPTGDDAVDAVLRLGIETSSDQ
jgi:ankyrin repeat protein